MLQLFYVNNGDFDYKIYLEERKTINNKLSSVSIFIGKKRKPCIELYLFGSDNIASLQFLNFYESCSPKGLIRSKGTRHMLTTAVYFLISHYPQVKHIRFTDSSHVKCFQINDKVYDISLSSLYFVIHNQTWYEKYFHAYFENPEFQKKYESRKKQFQESNDLFNFTQFIQYFQIPPQYIPILAPIYQNSDSYSDFFQKLQKQHSEQFCPIIRDWIHDFIEKYIGVFFYSSEWLMDTETFIKNKTIYEENEIELTPKDETYFRNMSGGGYRKQKKNMEFGGFPWEYDC